MIPSKFKLQCKRLYRGPDLLIKQFTMLQFKFKIVARNKEQKSKA